MNNKYLGMLSTMLWSPDPVTSGSGASVESPGGAAPAAAPAIDNIYSDKPDHPELPKEDGGQGGTNPEGDEKPDFTDANTDAIVGEEGEGVGEEPELDENGQPKPVVVAKPAEPVVMKLDAETLAALRGPAAVARQEPAKLTPAQLREMLNPVEVTDEVVANMVHEDPAVRKATLQNFANATVKNAVSVTRILIKQARQEVQAALGPITQTMEKQQAEAQKNGFYAANKDLVKYEKIVGLAASEVDLMKFDGTEKTVDEIYKEVGEKTRATLKSYGITLSPNANPGAAAVNGGNRQVPLPNRLSGAGRSGGDNNGQRGRANNPDADIYAR